MPIEQGAAASRGLHSFSWELPSGIAIEASIGATDGLLQRFFAGYDKAFVLENEKEGIEGFAECLALNEGANYRDLCQVLGPFREFIFLATDSRTGVQFGGGNMIVFPVELHGKRPATVLSVNLNYIFVEPEIRGRGYFSILIRDLPIIATTLFSRSNPRGIPPEWSDTYIFFEQNDPFKMGREEYERDTCYTGMDQLHRIGIWARRGAKIVDFDYVQPALTAGQKPDRNLVYGLIGPSQSSLDACLLFEHLRRFFGISVLKGKDPAGDPEARKQLDDLSVRCARNGQVDLLSVDETKLRGAEQQEAARGFASLRDAIKSGC
ncbi:MAG: hypothetical protein ACLPWS_17465 [Rhodomicrobium sp.]